MFKISINLDIFNYISYLLIFVYVYMYQAFYIICVISLSSCGGSSNLDIYLDILLSFQLSYILICSIYLGVRALLVAVYLDLVVEALAIILHPKLHFQALTLIIHSKYVKSLNYHIKTNCQISPPQIKFYFKFLLKLSN